MRIFPNAKVVLTTRDPERWYESVKGTIFQVRGFTSGAIGIFNKLVGNFKRFNMACVMSNQEHHVNRRGITVFQELYNTHARYFWQASCLFRGLHFCGRNDIMLRLRLG